MLNSDSKTIVSEPAECSVVFSAMSLGSLEPLSWNFISPHRKHRSCGFLSSFSRNQVFCIFFQHLSPDLGQWTFVPPSQVAPNSLRHLIGCHRCPCRLNEFCVLSTFFLPASQPRVWGHFTNNCSSLLVSMVYQVTKT